MDECGEERGNNAAKEIEATIADLSLEAFMNDIAVDRTFSGPAVKRAREMGKGDIGQRAEAAWEAAAKLGDAEGQFQHGITCYDEDKSAANRWWTQAAASGHLAAQYWLGLQCYTGDGIRRDIESAVRFLTASAQQGNGRAALVLSCIREETPEWLKRLLREAVEAKMDVGLLNLRIEWGDPSDDTLADLVELRKAIEAGKKVEAARDRAPGGEKI